MGEIIEDHMGVIFVWGTFIGNIYLPGGLTYAYGFLQLICFHMPLTLILAHHVDCRSVILIILSGQQMNF